MEKKEKVKKELLPGRESYCPKHPDKMTILYCVNCKEVICELCRTLKHSEHKLNPLDSFDEYNKLSYLQQQIGDTEKRLSFLNSQVALAKEQLETAQILLKKGHKSEETERDLYIQCLQFAREARRLESHVIIVTVIRKSTYIGFVSEKRNIGLH